MIPEDYLHLPNDSSRPFSASINEDTRKRLYDFISNNDTSNLILIGLSAVNYYAQPRHSHTIQFISTENKIINDIQIINYEDLGITEHQYNDIIASSLESDMDIRICNASNLLSLYLKSDDIYTIHFLTKGAVIHNNIIERYNSYEEIKKYFHILIYNSKDYNMNYINNYKEFFELRIYEGMSDNILLDVAFENWIENTKSYNQVLIGGLAFLNYMNEIPKEKRETYDADFIFLSDDEIPVYVNDFKKVRNHAFRHKNHIEIETLSPEFLNLNTELIKIVFDTAFKKDSYKIASPSAIIALKLERLDIKDINDIEKLKNNYEIDLSLFKPHLSKKALGNLEKLENQGISF